MVVHPPYNDLHLHIEALRQHDLLVGGGRLSTRTARCIRLCAGNLLAA